MSASKTKGDNYERELAAYLASRLGLPVNRTIMSGGGRNMAQLPDLEGTPHLWVEAKRTERFEPLKAMRQAITGKTARHCPDMPVVINRKNRQATEHSLVVLHLEDFVTLYEAFLKREGIIKDATNI